MSVDVYNEMDLWRLEQDVRGRLEDMPAGGLVETTGVCIDARAGHPNCAVLGIDGLRHVVRYQGATHGMCTDLMTVLAIDDPDRLLKVTNQTHKIGKEVHEALEETGPKPSVHEDCTDMKATPETVQAMSVFNRQVFRIARKILQGALCEKDNLRIAQGANLIENLKLIHPDETAVLRHYRQQRMRVAKLRDSNKPREGLIINRTGMLLPPMEYDDHGIPKHHLIYDSDDHLVIPTLTEIGQDLLSKKIKQRTLEVVSAIHLAILAHEKIKLPYERVIILE